MVYYSHIVRSLVFFYGYAGDISYEIAVAITHICVFSHNIMAHSSIFCVNNFFNASKIYLVNNQLREAKYIGIYSNCLWTYCYLCMYVHNSNCISLIQGYHKHLFQLQSVVHNVSCHLFYIFL